MKKNIIIRITISGLILVAAFCRPAFSASNPKKYFDKGLAYLKSHQNKKAKAQFKKTSDLSLGHYPSLYNVALLSFMEKDYAATGEYLTKAKQFNPYDIRTDQLLASYYLISNKFPEAQKSLSDVLVKSPQDVFARQMMSMVYMRTNKFDQALQELTTARNLDPSDMTTDLLFAMAYVLKGDFKMALEKIEPVKNQLSDEKSKLFLAAVLQNSQPSQDASKTSNIEKTVFDLLKIKKESMIADEVKRTPFIKEYQNPEVSKRLAEKAKKQKDLNLPDATKVKKELPYGIKATWTETFEHYDRHPQASNPINGLNVISNMKIQGKTPNGIDLKGEWEGYYNRWDDQKLDYYKINAKKRDDFEVDIGKFSSKHFPSLVNYPTVLEGIRVWKKINQPEFQPTPTAEIPEGGDAPINLGEIYRKNNVDHRILSHLEFVGVVGVTKEPINLNARKEKNEHTYDTTGQFEQWTQSYRLQGNIGIFETGVSASITQDRTRSAEVASSTTPIGSSALGIDGGIDLLDKDLALNWELAYSNYDEDKFDNSNKHLHELSYIFESEYKMFDTVVFSYDLKNIGRHFKVEGATQTEDKITHDIEWKYKPKDPQEWRLKQQKFNFKPEIVGQDGGGDTKKRYRTFQSVTDFKLPQDAEFTVDYKYYREKDKSCCSNYKTTTWKYSLDWTFDEWNTTLKPEYVFERKNDMLASATDEKKKEYKLSIENTSIKDWKFEYSWKREKKKYNGVTTKSYHQYINKVKAKYSIIPSRFDMTFTAENDLKNSSDTNKTDISKLTFETTYTSKSGDNKFNIKYERKDNIYIPWSDTSAYRQNYVKLKYTRKF